MHRLATGAPLFRHLQAEAFAGELNVSEFTFDSGVPHDWRCRARLTVRGSAGDPLIGLYKEGTHEAINIPGACG